MWIKLTVPAYEVAEPVDPLDVGWSSPAWHGDEDGRTSASGSLISENFGTNPGGFARNGVQGVEAVNPALEARVAAHRQGYAFMDRKQFDPVCRYIEEVQRFATSAFG
ncbi:hypothetical protein CLAFUW4_09362 [Fulvia fulva]|uniref:Uncharacterized protein n=1 Tax=Passalora fulva TaxID=5499 RepID=A0A9Q8UTJ0_PASFU|nr:uncharacterized protein CLAFUR5_09461 [Fulvia fulva]KAK4613258.1 hypothetical protein CLAFUR4_09368 [Fulvia fulva]KAK4614906.1 hypothetical protein CLAFUR0_09359 [Fulvia fulva]UJO21837.1 hypothetical protein CLAFUR5_09461 [Fulvia fulva]WPV19885.1 hypothetical protein CLAFUW4_09362 [Fulvia fulva]WPV34790.1 hypothetical protein CLAFUW7_09363 [Fulvia fulva]